MKEYLVIRTEGELRQVASEHILYMVTNKNFSEVHLINGASFNVPILLGKIAEMIRIQLPHSHVDFVRVGKSLIINLTYLHYILPLQGKLELLDRNLDKVVLNASEVSLKKLMDLLDSRININR